MNATLCRGVVAPRLRRRTDRSGGRWLPAAGLLLLIWLVARPAMAADLQYYGNSTTIPYYFTESIADKNKSYLALYEFLDFGASNIGVERLEMYFSGWGRGDAIDKLDPEDKAVGDAQLNSAFVRWHDQDNVFDASLGRRLVVIGPVAEQVDGAVLQLEPIDDIGIQGFGGVPVFSEVGERDGDWGYGGRFYAGWRPYIEAGFSAAAFTEKGDPDRRIFGGDLTLFPIANLDVMGHAYYDLLYSSWYDTDGMLVIRPVEDLKLLGEYQRLMPSAYLGMGSFFSVFSFDTIDKIQSEARYVAVRRIALGAQYDHYVYDGADPADRYGGSLGVLWGDERTNTVNVGLYRLDRQDNGYRELRGYFYQRFGASFYVVLDAIHYQLDEQLYGVGQGFNGTGSLGFKFNDALNLLVTGMYLTSPYYDSDLRGLLKLTYNFGRRDILYPDF